MIRAPSSIASDTSAQISSSRVGQRRAAALDVVQAADDVGGEAGQVAVAVDVEDLGQLVVVDHRERQHDLAAGRRASARAGCASGPMRAGQRGDELLADRVQRRVGDLREQLA